MVMRQPCSVFGGRGAWTGCDVGAISTKKGPRRPGTCALHDRIEEGLQNSDGSCALISLFASASTWK